MQTTSAVNIGIAFLTIASALTPAGVEASASKLAFSASIEAADYSAEEYRFGTLFNREVGTLYGPYLHGHYAYGSLRVSIEQRHLSNTIAYHGQNQFGFPIESQTSLRYLQSGISATYQLHGTPFHAGLALRKREIDRRIHETPITQELRETLRQTERGLVVGVEKRLSDNIVFVGDVMALTTKSSTLSVDFLGTYDAGKLTLPGNSSRELQLLLRYDIKPSFAVVAKICGQRFSPEKSSTAVLTTNGIPVGTYNYPGSTQEIWTLGLGAQIQW